MNDEELRARPREAVAHVDRGECTIFSSDDPAQPAGVRCSNDRPCEMCDGECPAPHIHVYVRARLLSHPLPEEPRLGYTAAAWNELQDSARRIGERLSTTPHGCCSEGCALRFVGGELTLQEIGEHPSLTVLSRPQPSQIVDKH